MRNTKNGALNSCGMPIRNRVLAARAEAFVQRGTEDEGRDRRGRTFHRPTSWISGARTLARRRWGRGVPLKWSVLSYAAN